MDDVKATVQEKDRKLHALKQELLGIAGDLIYARRPEELLRLIERTRKVLRQIEQAL